MEQKITDNYHTYSSIPNTKNILSILVDNINGNDLFQKHVTKLSSSNKSVDIKKAQVIKNTIQNIKVFNTNSFIFYSLSFNIIIATKMV